MQDFVKSRFSNQSRDRRLATERRIQRKFSDEFANLEAEGHLPIVRVVETRQWYEEDMWTVRAKRLSAFVECLECGLTADVRRRSLVGDLTERGPCHPR